MKTIFTNESDNRYNKMILLFAGSYKPFHDGHFYMIKKSIEANKPEKAYIIISKKEREGLKAKHSLKFISKVFEDEWKGTKIEVLVSSKSSPIKEAYKIVKDYKKETMFALVTSKKDGESDTRARDFYKAFKKGGRLYKNGGPYAVKLDKDYEKVFKYKNRNDTYKSKPVSGTVARKDVASNDFKKFLTNFDLMLEESFVSIKDIEDYFKALRKEIHEDGN